MGGIILSLMIVLMIIFSKQVDPIIQNVFLDFQNYLIIKVQMILWEQGVIVFVMGLSIFLII